MAKSTIHSGWRRDTDTNTLDLVVDGVEVTKYAAKIDNNAEEAPLNLYADSTTQLYDLGTRLQVDDRTFRYARAGSALKRYDGACNYDAWTLTNEASNQNVTVGATSVQVVNTTATKDLYKGGWIVIYTSRMQVRHIIGNDASDDTDTKLYIDGPIESAGTTPHITGYPSIYYDTRQGISNEYTSVVCIPNCEVASGSYYWGQTWGPCCGRAAHTVPGLTLGDREVYFAGAGSLYGGIQAETVVAGGYQKAGYLLPHTSSGGDQFYMLQLTP